MSESPGPAGGPDRQCEGHRAGQPPVARLRAQPHLVPDGGDRRKSDGMDGAVGAPAGGRATVGAQETMPPPVVDPGPDSPTTAATCSEPSHPTARIRPQPAAQPPEDDQPPTHKRSRLGPPDGPRRATSAGRTPGTASRSWCRSRWNSSSTTCVALYVSEYGLMNFTHIELLSHDNVASVKDYLL